MDAAEPNKLPPVDVPPKADGAGADEPKRPPPVEAGAPNGDAVVVEAADPKSPPVEGAEAPNGLAVVGVGADPKMDAVGAGAGLPNANPVLPVVPPNAVFAVGGDPNVGAEPPNPNPPVLVEGAAPKGDGEGAAAEEPKVGAGEPKGVDDDGAPNVDVGRKAELLPKADVDEVEPNAGFVFCEEPNIF